mmetsp:Transcript_12184/g.40072  ORF Transcript_12184/g.40072 Transcript_12184/m.40072 type:complete len:105 (+) Transcript_12184:160-474(+)
MKRQSDEYVIYFDGREEWMGYIAAMSMQRTWGDELTIRAACNEFKLKITVIQSTRENWCLEYVPEEEAPSSGIGIFLAYVAPVHYNSITDGKAKKSNGNPLFSL